MCLMGGAGKISELIRLSKAHCGVGDNQEFVMRMKRRWIATAASIVVSGAVSVSSSFAAAGDLYVAVGPRSSGDSAKILRITPAGSVSTFANANASGLAFDSAGNMYAATGTIGTVDKFTPDGTRTTFASALTRPLDVAVDRADNIYVSDAGTNVIYKFTTDGTKVPFASGLNLPAGLGLDSADNVYCANDGTGEVLKFTPGGDRTTAAAGFTNPRDVVFDPRGNMYVVEFNTHVFKITPAGIRTLLPPMPERGYSLATNATGQIALSDTASGSVIILDPEGTPIQSYAEVQSPRLLAFEPNRSPAVNISTRMRVLSGDNALIAGFILTGTESKKVIIRGMGPSLSNFGIQGALADPVLELRNQSGGL